MADPEITRRLDSIISIMQLAYDDEIQRARVRHRADDAKDRILNLTANDYVAAGQLKTAVAKATGESERTVLRRITELVSLGALEVRPTGTAAYKATGLI